MSTTNSTRSQARPHDRASLADTPGSSRASHTPITSPTGAPTTNYAVAAHGLTRTFGTFTAVDHLDLNIATGTVYGLLGPNGAGKSTALKMLTTLLHPTSGTATVMGHDLLREAHAVRSRIGVAGQYASVDETLTGQENLRLFARLTGLSHRGSRRRADELLESFGLTDAARRPVRGYSGGMRRRLDLAVSLTAAPPLVFLDEPTTGLDPRTREQMWGVVENLVDQGTTILLTTQYLEEADRLAHRIGIIDHGRMVAEGTADELKDRVGSSTLILTPASPEAASHTAAIIGQVIGDHAAISQTAGRIHVPLADAAAATEVLVALRAHDLTPQAVSVDRPSLNSVFLALTQRGHGRPAPDGTTGAAPRAVGTHNSAPATTSPLTITDTQEIL